MWARGHSRGRIPAHRCVKSMARRYQAGSCFDGPLIAVLLYRLQRLLVRLRCSGATGLEPILFGPQCRNLAALAREIERPSLEIPVMTLFQSQITDEAARACDLRHRSALLRRRIQAEDCGLAFDHAVVPIVFCRFRRRRTDQHHSSIHRTTTNPGLTHHISVDASLRLSPA